MNIIKYIKISLIGIAILALVIMAVIIKKQNENLRLYDTNFKALNLENDALSKEVIAYKFSAEQLEYINDSIIKDLNNTRKELGIKDKQLKQIQSIKTEILIRDSVFFRDTIFKDNFIKIDTVLGDAWYKAKLTLEQPNKIGLSMYYKSDLSIIAYSSKEILGTPKKCWLGRLFQKRQNVIRVAVQDKNPHSVIKEKKFVIVE